MKKQSAIAAKWSWLIASSALASALAACGSGYEGSDARVPAAASLTADRTTITLGQSVTLTWTSNQSTRCTASGGWSGVREPSGTAEVTPAATGELDYTIACSGAGSTGAATGSVRLTVQPASAYLATSLVEDFRGGASRSNDDLLVSPWGLAYGPTTGIWVTNNHSESATIYDGNGRPSPLVVHFLPSVAGVSFDGTAVVFNGTQEFVLTQRGPAVFIFAGEGGMIAGWSPNGEPSSAVTTYTAADGAAYKGLTLARNGDANFLYAADFANGKVDVLDATFAKQASTTASFGFEDPTLPAGYAPFGIQALKNSAGATRIYVSYAKRDASAPSDDAPGQGLGLVDVYDTNGTLLRRLVTEGGKLNAPWGMALAPADFGTLSNALLVGNFGDGAIHGYDPSSGRYLGAVTNGAGTPYAEPGLRGVAFGNDAANQPHATLFFAAGINGEVNGRYGRIDLGQTPPSLGEPPALTLVAPQGDVSGTVTLTANAQNLVAIAKVQFFANGSTPIATATNEPFTVEWDTRKVPNGGATLRAVATDPNGNVGSSRVVTVFVAN